MNGSMGYWGRRSWPDICYIPFVIFVKFMQDKLIEVYLYNPIESMLNS